MTDQWINRLGDPVEETQLFKFWSDSATDDERDTAISMILDYLRMEIVRTNATKHGTTELELREIDADPVFDV
jgi:hypothetical protein